MTCAMTIWPYYVTQQRLKELKMYSKLFGKRGIQSYIPTYTAALVFRSYDHCLLDFASYIKCLLEVATLLYAPQESGAALYTKDTCNSGADVGQFSSFLQTRSLTPCCRRIYTATVLQLLYCVTNVDYSSPCQFPNAATTAGASHASHLGCPSAYSSRLSYI